MTKRSFEIFEGLDAKTKICKVCGDKATCFNFAVIACESCKSFFRRNGNLTPDNFRCPYNGNCVIDVNTRKSCKHCRLAKCLQLGMRIPKEKVYAYKGKIIKSENEETFSFTTPTRSLEGQTITLMSNNHAQMRVHYQTRSTNQSIYPAALEVMNQQERSLIYEIWEASNCLTVSREKLATLDNQGLMDVDSAMSLMDQHRKKLIEMFNNIKYFTSLSKNDQIMLIKGSLAEIYFIYQLQCFDRVEEKYNCCPYSPKLGLFITFDHIKEMNEANFNMTMRFLTTFDPDWQNDRTLMIILMLITLFTPKSVALEDCQRIAEFHIIYKNLLRMYLKTQHSCPVRADYVAEALYVKLAEIQQLQYSPAHFFIRPTSNIAQPLITDEFANDDESAEIDVVSSDVKMESSVGTIVVQSTMRL